jgi:DNA repair exonuclease SbcCD ATPase subunit
VSLHKNRAEEILDLCLSSESPQMRAKVYEIINQSGLLPNDPMFLVLALTGQMRVFLEAAPKELIEAISSIKQNLEIVNAEFVSDVRALNKQTLAQILAHHVEVEQNIQESVEEIKKIKQELEQTRAEIQSERNTNVKVMKALIEGVGKTTDDLELLLAQLKIVVSIFRNLKITRILNKWVIWGSFVTSVIVIILLLWKN